jgi:hypothetical protein
MQELDVIFKTGWHRVFDVATYYFPEECSDGILRPLYFNQEGEMETEEIQEILLELEFGSSQSAN